MVSALDFEHPHLMFLSSCANREHIFTPELGEHIVLNYRGRRVHMRQDFGRGVLDKQRISTQCIWQRIMSYELTAVPENSGRAAFSLKVLSIFLRASSGVNVLSVLCSTRGVSMPMGLFYTINLHTFDMFMLALAIRLRGSVIRTTIVDIFGKLCIGH